MPADFWCILRCAGQIDPAITVRLLAHGHDHTQPEVIQPSHERSAQDNLVLTHLQGAWSLGTWSGVGRIPEAPLWTAARHRGCVPNASLLMFATRQEIHVDIVQASGANSHRI
jgi:hypothetical protein